MGINKINKQSKLFKSIKMYLIAYYFTHIYLTKRYCIIKINIFNLQINIVEMKYKKKLNYAYTLSKKLLNYASFNINSKRKSQTILTASEQMAFRD